MEDEMSKSEAKVDQEKMSKAVSQKEAVYKTVLGVLGDFKVQTRAGSMAKDLLTPEMKSKIYDVIERGLKNGRVSLKENDSNKSKISDPKALRIYVIGLVSNWLKRDKRLSF